MLSNAATEGGVFVGDGVGRFQGDGHFFLGGLCFG